MSSSWPLRRAPADCSLSRPVSGPMRPSGSSSGVVPNVLSEYASGTRAAVAARQNRHEQRDEHHQQLHLGLDEECA